MKIRESAFLYTQWIWSSSVSACPPTALIELLVSVCLSTGPSWLRRNADSWVIFHNTRRKWNCRANSCYQRYVISMLKRTKQKPFQWWILDFIYIYVNVQEHKHTLKKKKEDFSVFKKNAKCLIHLKSSKSTIFCHWKLFMVKEYFLSALAWNTRGLDCCCHFKTIFYSFKGRAFYVIYNLYRSGKKNQILKLEYEIPMYTSQYETFSGG